MLKKQNRLTTKFQFNVVRKYGQRIPNEYFVFTIVKPTNYEGDTKVGIIVSNAIHKKAARRNKVKRYLRESFKTRIDTLPKNCWAVISVKTGILEKTYEDISTQVDKTIQKISIAN